MLKKADQLDNAHGLQQITLYQSVHSRYCANVAKSALCHF